MKKSLTIILATFICCAAHAQSIPDAPILGGDPSDNVLEKEIGSPEDKPVFTNDYNIWASVSIRQHFGEKWDIMGRVELRTKNTCQDLNRVIVRIMPSYKPCNWFKIGVGADYIANWSGSNNASSTPIFRAMVDLTESCAAGGVRFAFRERYMYAYDMENARHTHTARAKMTVSYPLQGGRFEPYVAGEIFYWGVFNQARAFAGTKIGISQHLTLDLCYLGQIQMKNRACNHVSRAALTFSF